MSITINQITSGIGLIVDGVTYVVTEYHHVKPGKGAAFVRVKMRNINTDAVLERTFRTADRLDDIPLTERKLEYLYVAGDRFHFMDHSTYEAIEVDRSTLGDAPKFFLENMEVAGLFTEHKLLKVMLPNFIIAQIKETEQGIRGDSTKSGGKPAKIETGTTIQVPLFINVGDWVKLDTRTGGQYVERVQR